MKRILNREVNVCGVLHPYGTDVSTLPEGTQRSVIDAGWTVEVDESTQESDEGDDEGDQDKAQTSDDASAGPSDQPGVSDQVADVAGPVTVQNNAQPTPTDTRPLSELGVDAAKLDLLAANDPPITTVQQALDFLAINKTFRTIAGFGKQADQDLRQKLGVL
jgi:hypothetical protein